jgi:hypothetical protein
MQPSQHKQAIMYLHVYRCICVIVEKKNQKHHTRSEIRIEKTKGTLRN